LGWIVEVIVPHGPQVVGMLVRTFAADPLVTRQAGMTLQLTPSSSVATARSGANALSRRASVKRTCPDQS
jgi:hypothetical protein